MEIEVVKVLRTFDAIKAGGHPDHCIIYLR